MKVEVDNMTTIGENSVLYGFDDCLDMLRRHREIDKGTIERLAKENREIKDELYRDKYIQELRRENEKIKNDMYRGFCISEEEEKMIIEWKRKHLREKHPRAVNNPGYFGAAGGNWSYRFTPTGLGTIGEICCSCGEKFYFKELM